MSSPAAWCEFPVFRPRSPACPWLSGVADPEPVEGERGLVDRNL
jgi:hypothetical protein